MALDPGTRDWLLGLVAGAPPPADRVDWDAALPALQRHRLEGAALTSGGDLSQPVRAVLEPPAHRAGLATTLAVEGGERALIELGRVGIPALLFKGAALVRAGLYPHPSARPMDDADLLVPDGAGEAAFRALETAGFRPWSAWAVGRAAWLDSATLFSPTSTAALPTSLDLHWRLRYGALRFGERGGAALWERADLGAGLPAAERHLVVIAEHVVKHARVRPHLLAFGDLTRLAAQVSDWDDVVRTAREGGVGRGVGWVLGAARAGLAARVPESVVRELTKGRTGPTALDPGAMLDPARRLPGRAAGLGLRWRILGSPRAVAADLAYVAFPGVRWLRGRYGPGPSALLWGRYAVHALGWLVGVARSPASPNQELL
jgi:hypothetical protein